MAGAVAPRRLLVMPLARETAIVSAALAARHELVAVADPRLALAHVPDLDALVATGGHGKSQFALQTQYLIGRFPSLELVVCAGAAGRLDCRLGVGDLVVGTETVEHDFSVLMTPRPPPRFATPPGLIERVRRVASRERPYRVVLGAIASGDIDCVTLEQGRAIRDRTGAVCVAWEGAGAHRAAAFNGLACLELRAITDGGDAAAGADFRANLAHAMGNAASFLAECLETIAAGSP